MKSITSFCDFVLLIILFVSIFFIESLRVYPLSSNKNPLFFKNKTNGLAKCTITSSASTITSGIFDLIFNFLIC